MRKLSPIKDKTLSKVGFVKIGDFELPVKTSGLKKANISASKLAEMYKLPVSTRMATEEEVEELKKAGVEINGKVTPMVKEYNKTSKEYIKMEEDKKLNEVFLNIAIHIDLSYLVSLDDDKTEPLWKHLGLVSVEDILGLAKWLGDVETDMLDYQLAVMQINNIKQFGHRTYEDIPELAETPTIETKVEDNGEERQVITE